MNFKLTYRLFSLINYICLPDLLLIFNPVIVKSGSKRTIHGCYILKNNCSLINHFTVVCSLSWPLNGNEAIYVGYLVLIETL